LNISKIVNSILQILAKGYLHVIRLHCQFVLTSTEVLSQFYDYKKVDDLVHHCTPGRNENDSHISALQSLAKLTVTEPPKTAEEIPVPVPQAQGQSSSSWPPQLVPVTNSDKNIPDIWSQKPPKHPGYGNQRSYVTEGQPSRFGDIGSRAAAGQTLKNQNDVKTNRSVHLGSYQIYLFLFINQLTSLEVSFQTHMTHSTAKW
jgi:hypothetical protein